MACINGGVFIKVGQYLGALEYLLPQEYVECFKVLHSSAPESPLSDVCRVIQEDLGKQVWCIILVSMLYIYLFFA